MNYELALELKNAGFPLYKPNRESWRGHEIPKEWTNEQIKEYRDINWCVIIPTLSELIDACGNKGFMLVYRPYGKWNASLHIQDKDTNVITFEGEGSTPEEAVAHLWLAINKHE